VTKTADVHLFICARGQTLPRWRDAFRTAKAAKLGPEGLSRPVEHARVVWLRLDQPGDPAVQLALVPESLRPSPLVVLSDEPTDEQALAAFAAGARGYCNTHAAPPVLQQVAAVVLQGGLWIGESLMQRLLGATARILVPESARVEDPMAWAAGLTERERQVALTVAQGSSNKEIASLLGITERTVKAHVGAVLEKLGVRDRLQLSLIVNGMTLPPSS
jgi:DNA-binding NarL/FixJ family response regulator